MARGITAAVNAPLPLLARRFPGTRLDSCGIPLHFTSAPYLICLYRNQPYLRTVVFVSPPVYLPLVNSGVFFPSSVPRMN